MIIALVLACSGAVLNVIGPDKIGDLSNVISTGFMTGINRIEFDKIAYFLLTIYIIGFVFNYIQGLIMTTITQRISKKLRKDISEKINRLPLKYFDNTSHGNILSRVTNDVDTISMTLNNSLGTLVTSVTTFLGALLMMFYSIWNLAISDRMSFV